jgi:serine protease Do
MMTKVIKKNKKLLRSGIIFLLIISTVFASGCTGDKNSVVYQEADTGIFKLADDSAVENVKTQVDLTNRKEIMYALQDTYREVAKEVLPVIVEVNVVEVIKQNIPNNFFSPWDFFNREWPFGQQPDQDNNNNQPEQREFRKQGLGSGVIVGQSGNKHYVVTNNHVVGNADEISVRLNDGREFEARIIGKDARTDLALVSFESNEEIPIAVLGDSDNLMVGDFVFAVGNPLGFESTVTSGIVSAVGRRAESLSDISDFTDYIQTDAAINPGNSGGALVNLEGELIGINTWIASRTGGSDGLGFAIPVNNVKKAITDFVNTGKIVYGWLGVTTGDISEAVFYDFAEDMQISGKSGAFVFNVFENSPAAKGGILPGDFIIKIGDQEIEDSNHLTRVVGNLPPGEAEDLKVIRYGTLVDLSVRFEVREDEESIQNNVNLWPGIFVQSIPDDKREQLGIPADLKGIMIGGLLSGSSAEIAGFRQGDVIVKMNNSSINGVMDFYKHINDQDKEEITFRIYRGGNEILLGLVK